MTVAAVINTRRASRRITFVVLSATALIGPWTAASAKDRTSPAVIRCERTELRFATPYQPGKVPVVLVHGLLGGPGSWSVMIDRLSSDPVVRARFQFLIVQYDTLQSIPESGVQLATVVDDARRRFDPEGRDRSFDRVVLVGHSMGGLVVKAASETLDRERFGGGRVQSGEDRLSRSPGVERFVFIATPHRGATIDRGAVRSVGTWVAQKLRPPSPIQAAPISSIDQLAWEHPVLAELERARATARTPFHSIIASLSDPSVEGATDGVVPVASARLRGAESELVVRTPHGCFNQPVVIEEVRKILIGSAAQYAGPSLKTDGRSAPGLSSR
jgi:pimeloyl-ACP methyl ester carboxylesterase